MSLLIRAANRRRTLLSLEKLEDRCLLSVTPVQVSLPVPPISADAVQVAAPAGEQAVAVPGEESQAETWMNWQRGQLNETSEPANLNEVAKLGTDRRNAFGHDEEGLAAGEGDFFEGLDGDEVLGSAAREHRDAEAGSEQESEGSEGERCDVEARSEADDLNDDKESLSDSDIWFSGNRVRSPKFILDLDSLGMSIARVMED